MYSDREPMFSPRKSGTGMIYTISPSVVFFFTILYSTVMAAFLVYGNLDIFPIFWLLGMIVVKPLYRSGAYWIEASILLLVYLFVKGEAGYRDIYVYLPLASTVLMLAAYKTGMRVLKLSVPLLVIGWFAVILGNSPGGLHQGTQLLIGLNYKTGFLLVCTVLSLAFYSIESARNYPPLRGKADLILCSHSGNTAHYARECMQGMQEAGMDVKLHRFHYYDEFNPDLTGDNLIIAFPVAGWKPPWPLVSYLIKKLPRGRGKPCFVLYTSAGGPENAGIVAWVILTMKGYHVAGRSWAMYPLNVVTFRLGTKKIWRFIDTLTPFKAGLEEAKQCGREFAGKKAAGIPFIFWPFPLFIAGFILDNKWTNMFLYRNKSWKRRCTKCGLCISSCPSQRLHKNEAGYPHARGTCSLCLLCINICPTNAMQLLFWSEYGQPYSPRWPELVITKKEKSLQQQ
jgi:ferredoxin